LLTQSNERGLPRVPIADPESRNGGNMMSQVVEQGQSDKKGEIACKFGNTELRNLRNIYGRAFGVGLPEHMRLSELIGRMEDRGLWQLYGHYGDGSLERRIREAGG
jgi:hypothetical protein